MTFITYSKEQVEEIMKKQNMIWFFWHNKRTKSVNSGLRMIKEQTHNSTIGGPRSYILLIPWPINYFELRTKSFLQSIFNNFSDIPVYLYRGAKGIYNPHILVLGLS
jgi:hypothetical protein